MKHTSYIAAMVGLSMLLPTTASDAGPAGPDGSPQVFFAHIFADGSIEQETAVGITQENVRRADIPDPVSGSDDKIVRYCLSGLPRRIWGGQVTVDMASMDPNQKLTLMPSFHIHTNMEEPNCTQRIVIWDGTWQAFAEGNRAASFYLLLY